MLYAFKRRQPGDSGYIFLSHAGADSAAANDLANALRSNGLGVWIDGSDLHPGDNWNSALQQAIERASGMIPALQARPSSLAEGHIDWWRAATFRPSKARSTTSQMFSRSNSLLRRLPWSERSSART